MPASCSHALTGFGLYCVYIMNSVRKMCFSSKNYYPFGMVMPERSFSYDKYQFGFNGKENDNEVYGTGNFQDYGMRMYSPRLSRFISPDPIAKKFPELSTFQFASNSPIGGIDLDGLELQPINSSMYRQRYNMVKSVNEIYTVEIVESNVPEAYVDFFPRTDVGAHGLDTYYSGPMIYPTGTPPPPPVEDDGQDAKYTTVESNPKHNFKYITEKYNIKANNANGIGQGLMLAHDLTKWAKTDLPQQLASIDEQEDRSFFYSATNLVDFYIKNGQIEKVGAGSLVNGKGRADLINYVNDGTLPQLITKGSPEEIKQSQDYNNLVKGVGNGILLTNDYPVRTRKEEQ